MDIEPEVIEAPEVEELEQPEVADVEAEEENETGLVVNIDADGDDDADVGKRNMRNRIKELTAKLKEHESKAVAQTAPALRAKPTADDHDFDNEAFAADLEKWFEEKRDHDKAEDERKSVAERAEQRWQQKLSFYDEGKSKLGAQDYEDAEATVMEIFSKPFPGIVASDNVHLGLIKQAFPKDAAMLVYALGKNKSKAQELAEIDDPAEFVGRLGELKATMKVNRGGAKVPAPERRIAGGSAPGVTATNDRTLEKLLAEADKTGDYTALGRYKRSLQK